MGLFDFTEKRKHFNVVMDQETLQFVPGLRRFEFQQNTFARFLTIKGIARAGRNENDMVSIGNIFIAVLDEFAVA